MTPAVEEWYKRHRRTRQAIHEMTDVIDEQLAQIDERDRWAALFIVRRHLEERFTLETALAVIRGTQ